MVSRQWIWGDRRVGYAVRKLARKKRPWQSEVWFHGRIWRIDEWETKEDALDYARQRKRNFYGGKSAERVLKDLKAKGEYHR